MKILVHNYKGQVDTRKDLPSYPSIGDAYRIGYWDWPESMIERVIWTKDGWRKTDDVFNEYREYVYRTLTSKEMTEEQRFKVLLRAMVYTHVDALAYAYNDLFKEDCSDDCFL